MCYAFNPDKTLDIEIPGANNSDYVSLFDRGLVPTASNGFYYPKAMVGAFYYEDDQIKVAPMRWDLIYRKYLAAYKDFTLEDVVTKKNSRAKIPGSTRRWGFDTYNARSEEISTTWSYRDSWNEGKRCVVPLSAFRERANMDDAPPEFKNKEFQVDLDDKYLLGCIWDRFTRFDRSLLSCSAVTLDSFGQTKIQAIYHERHPLVLTLAEAIEWLDPRTPTRRAMEMVRLIDGSRIVNVIEIPPIHKIPKIKP